MIFQKQENSTKVYFEYDADLVEVVKRVKGRKFNPDDRSWIIPNKSLEQLREELEAKGYDEFAERLAEYTQTEIGELEEEELKIEIRELNSTVELKFDYDPDLVEAIKKIDVEKRKFDSDNKSWKIRKEDKVIEQIINKLKQFNVNMDALYAIKSKLEEQELRIQLEVQRRLERAVYESLLTPYSHQKQAAEFLLYKKKAILADEMGGGKTLSAILAGNTIDEPKLIICPASLKLNWKKEVERTGKTAEVVNGKKEHSGNADFVIINFDILNKHFDSLKAFKNIIVDEAHFAKAVNNSGKPASKRAELTLNLATEAENIWLLTGTPFTNKVKDLYNLLRAISHPLGEQKFFYFGKRYCNGNRNRFGWDFNGASNTIELHEKLQEQMMRRLKEELLELPEKVRSFIPVTIKMAEYNKKLNEYLEARPATEAEHLVYLNAMKHILAIEKVKSTMEMAENLLEQEKKVVIFTNYTEVVNQLMEKFGEAAVKVTGEDSQDSKQKAIEKFQTDDKVNVFVGNMKAAGVGITLTVSKNVIFNDFDWVPANHTQAEDRIHRIGQQQGCNIYYMYVEDAAMDRILADVLEEKTKTMNQIIDGGKEGEREERVIKKVIKEMNKLMRPGKAKSSH